MKNLFWCLILLIGSLSVAGLLFSPILLGYAFLLWRFVLIPYCCVMVICWIVFGSNFDDNVEVLLNTHYDFDDNTYLDIELSSDGVQYFLKYSENSGSNNVAIFDSLAKVSEFMRERFGVDLSI